MFHGDTLNVHVSLTSIIIPLAALSLVLIFFVIRKDLSDGETLILWSASNKKLSLIIFGMLPIQGVLFYMGDPHGITDQIGVILSLLQCFLIPVIIHPYSKDSVVQKSFS